jgi:hypothetical protein
MCAKAARSEIPPGNSGEAIPSSKVRFTRPCIPNPPFRFRPCRDGITRLAAVAYVPVYLQTGLGRDDPGPVDHVKRKHPVRTAVSIR